MLGKSVCSYLENTVNRYPNQLAVVDGQNALTFRDLATVSDGLARFFVKIDVNCGDRIAFFLKRGSDCIIAAVGILKTGAAYVPVDQHTPIDRWYKIISDATPKAIVCDGSTLVETLARVKEIEKKPYIICLSHPEKQNEHHSEVFFYDEITDTQNVVLPNNISLDDAAYVLYTSGSTGSPKGVMITHGNIRNYIDWAIDYFQITANDRILSTAPFHFDMSTFDIFCALAVGATLCIATGGTLLFPEKLVQFAEREKITLWKGVSSLLMYMCRAGAVRSGRIPTLRTVIFAGEPLASQYLKQWMESFPKTLFYNGYGPTEATGVSFCYHVKEAPESDQPIPIGRPCKGAKAVLIGDDELPVGIGEIGELLIAGDCLAKGYLNDIEKTQKYFTSPPPNCNIGERVYWTGDLVRQTTEGDYVFVSRKDQQVKWMGYRIELGEIETNLLAHPQVKDAVVLLVNMENCDLAELVAFIEVEDNFEVQKLSRFLGNSLSSYMVPKRFVKLNSMPRNDRGKVDRNEILENYSLLVAKDDAR